MRVTFDAMYLAGWDIGDHLIVPDCFGHDFLRIDWDRVMRIANTSAVLFASCKTKVTTDEMY